MASNPNKANETQIKSTADEIKENDYCFLLQEEDKAGFSANDLVWSKIKSHPWWPAQIFDPKYASETALKCQKKNHFLVAYFGTKTFAWVPESQLKPFQSHFSEMEEQSATTSFTSAVSAVLEEVLNRVESGLACHCSADGGYDRLLACRKVENAGVREGTCSVVDKFAVADAFRPESLLGYVWALARCPSRGFVRLELMVAMAQLKAFYRLKGHSHLPRFASYAGLVENEAEISHLKSARPRGRPRKIHINGDGSEHKCPSNKMEEEEEDADKGRSENDGVGEGVGLKIRTTSSTRTRTRFIKLGDHISQAVNSLNEESPLIINSMNDTPESIITKKSRRKGADDLSGAEKENEVAMKEYSFLGEMLSRLYLVARDPMKGYIFLPTIQGFFTDLRASYFSKFSEDQEPVKSAGRKRGRKKKVVTSEPTSLEMSDPDFKFSPSYNPSEDQGPVKSAGRKRGRKKKVVNCDPTSMEMSDPDFRLSPSSDSHDAQEPVRSMGRKSDRKKKIPTWLNEESPLTISSIDDPPEDSITKRSRRKGADHLSGAEKENEVAMKEYSSPSELLSQLYLVAGDPMKGYNFVPMIQGFFTDFRASYFSNSSEDQELVKSAGRKRGRKKKLVECEPTSLEMSDPDFRFSLSYNSSEDQEPVKSAGRKRGRKKKVVNCDAESVEMSDPDFRLSPSSVSANVQELVESMGRKSDRKKKVVNFEPDYIQDSYWSDIILQSSPEREPASKGQKRKMGSHKKGQTKKTKPIGEFVLYDPKAPSMDTEQNNLLVGFSNPHEKQEVKEERIVEETPTALILSFKDYESIPSASDLIKIFSSYGSLKEEETEVLRQTNRAKVVFKYRHDAENAFSIAGQLSVFGSTLVSYRLRYSPLPKYSPASSPLDMNYALPTKDGDLECPVQFLSGQEGIGGAIDNM